MSSFAERLSYAMSKRNMKQIDLIRLTGINKGALSSYINGRYIPKQTNLFLLAKALNVDEAWLMGYDIPMERKEVNLASDKNTLENWLKFISESEKIPLEFVTDCYNNSMYSDGIPITFEDLKNFIIMNYTNSKIDPRIRNLILDTDITNFPKQSEKDEKISDIIFMMHRFMTEEDINKLYKLIELTFPDAFSNYKENTIKL